MAVNDYLRFQRGNFLVKNIEKSLTFYQDVLGFELAFLKDSPDDSYSYPVFEIDKSHKMRFAVLSTADQVRVMALTILAVLRSFSRSVTWTPFVTAHGQRVVTFTKRKNCTRTTAVSAVKSALSISTITWS